MPLPIITDVCRVAVRGVAPSGQPMVNVLHFRNNTGSTMAAAQTAFHALLTTLYAAPAGAFGGNGWANNAHTSARIVDALYTPLDGTSASVVKTLTMVGTSAADAMPSDSAIVFTHRTALRGRAHRGRTYWGGFTETLNTSSGRVDTTPLAAFVTHWNGFLTALVAPLIPLQVASYVNATTESVLTVDANDKWDRQKRRS